MPTSEPNAPPSPIVPKVAPLAAWIAAGLMALAPAALTRAATEAPSLPEAAIEAARKDLLARHGAGEQVRIDRGLAQVRRVWRADDGDAQAFQEFVGEEFLPAGEPLDATFNRFEFAFERIGGYFVSMTRDLRRGVDLEIGPLLPLDERLAAFSPDAHLSDDLFASRLAFVVLLNFPLSTLEQRLHDGGGWSRRQWAETRLAEPFATRIPAEVNQALTAAYSTADSYINGYNIRMHHLLDAKGGRPFPAGLRLISHWGLRDELKARYADAEGLAKQRIIRAVMERIVRQEIPAAVVDNPLLDWDPVKNTVVVSKVKDAEPPAGASATPDAAREPDTRYRMWQGIFHAQQRVDPHTPDNPSHIARRFNDDREIPEAEVRRLFESVLTAPMGKDVAALIARRLGRPLEPHDIWYVGFKPRGAYSEEDLDQRTRARYPSVAAYAADIPRLLTELGFSAERAAFLADHIEVDPSRGAGHAMGAARRDDKAHLRTRVAAGGMDYKGYNIAVHEMGHNVEQVFGTTAIDHTLLQGVPNTAFTEALAFVFQDRDLELLGLSRPDAAAGHLKALEAFWATREIAGVALVDMEAWRWMYAHPEAEPSAFRAAVVDIARDVWNRYFAALLGERDVPLLAIYSHMIDSGLYTPDYPLGHLIAFQIEAHLAKQSPMGAEFERLCRLGNLTPDAWMRQGVGAPLSAEPMLSAAAAALEAVD